MTISLPCGYHNGIGFNFASVVERCTCLIEPQELWATLDLDSTVDGHRAGPSIWGCLLAR